MIEIPPELVVEITSRPQPLCIGISGVGGAGKSTFADALGRALRAPVIGIDNFQKNRTDNNYALWEIMDYARLQEEILNPFLSGNRVLRYGGFDWNTNAINRVCEIATQGMLIVEGVGLFRPGLRERFGYTIWVECPIDEALRRGKWRDRNVHNNPQDEAWDGVWKRNDEEYLAAYAPNTHADFIYSNAS